MTDTFSPELRTKNRITLAVILVIAIIAAFVPVIVRLMTTPIPTINNTARDLLPGEAAKTEHVVLYSAVDSWTQPVVARLGAHGNEVQRFFPDPIGDVEGVIFGDTDTFTQAWVQTFGQDNRAPGQNAVGRAGFFFVNAQPGTTPTARELADLFHAYGHALLELQMLERYRVVPKWYRHVVAEMVALTFVPEAAEAAQSEYKSRRATEPPPTEREFYQDFDGERASMNRLAATLMAARFITAGEPLPFVALADAGEDLETAFRAIARSSAPEQPIDPATGKPQPIRSGFDGVLEVLDETHRP